MTRPRLLILLLLAAPASALQEPAPFRNVHNLDAEHELDLRMGELPADARDAFRAAENAFQLSAGSLNIRHLFVREELKTRFPVVDERFWLRFRHRRVQDLSRDHRRNELELEWSPARRWFLSLVGDPAFQKSESSVGAAVRWGPSEARSIQAGLHWPDFDNNYAFSNRSVNEGFDRFYRRAPREARLSAVWIEGDTSLVLEGGLVRGWERVVTDFSDGARTVEEGARSEAAWDLRRRLGPWTWGLEGEAWRERFSARTEGAPRPGDRSQSMERVLGRLSLERARNAWRARAAAGGAATRGRLRHPANPASNDSHGILDRIYEASVFRRSGRGEWEWGYLYGRQRWRSGPALAAGGSVSQNRAKAGWRWDFSDRAWIKAAGAVELDRNQSESFLSFDGGTVLFQAAF